MTWVDDAACARTENAWLSEVGAWTEEDSPVKPAAVRLCEESCPVRNLCLQDAISDGEAVGIRGGYPFVDGKISTADYRRMKAEMGLEGRRRYQGRAVKSKYEDAS